MAAPKGNQFWMLRSKHGRDKLFATPEALWEAACEYFQWCDENPWTTRKAIQRTMPVRRKKGKRTETVNEQQTQQEVSPTQRPYSLTGLCIYLGTSSRWWSSFRSECMKKNDEDFLHVIARVEETIETHREIADAIAAHEPLRAQDAMYLHLVYNRKRIQMIKKGDLI